MRAYGARQAISNGADWLAFTYANSEVAFLWLTSQVELITDVVCGTMQVNDWGVYGKLMEHHFTTTYFDTDGHRHIHCAQTGHFITRLFKRWRHCGTCQQ